MAQNNSHNCCFITMSLGQDESLDVYLNKVKHAAVNCENNIAHDYTLWFIRCLHTTIISMGMFQKVTTMLGLEWRFTENDNKI